MIDENDENDPLDDRIRAGLRSLRAAAPEGLAARVLDAARPRAASSWRLPMAVAASLVVGTVVWFAQPGREILSAPVAAPESLPATFTPPPPSDPVDGAARGKAVPASAERDRFAPRRRALESSASSVAPTAPASPAPSLAPAPVRADADRAPASATYAPAEALESRFRDEVSDEVKREAEPEVEAASRRGYVPAVAGAPAARAFVGRDATPADSSYPPSRAESAAGTDTGSAEN